MVVNGRPMKRMKRRVTADLYDFLSFPSADDHPRGPFRANVKSFLTEYALCPPPASLIPHLLTWQVSFRVGDLTESFDSAPGVVSLDVVEEDVARSRSVYCDQCRVVGWSGHPVCSKRYHFIIKADGNSIGGYNKTCACCGDVLYLSESRCKTCNHITTTDDMEEWIYNQLEDTTHLLHGVIHANGYGHLLRVNGREGGSRLLSGCHIMNFWDRLCKTLGVRKISVMDVSKKYGLEYRLLHAITNGHPWYGNWGYEFGAGSFALTVSAYKAAVETLASQSLSQFLTQGQNPHTRLQEIILFYQSLSDCELVNTKDLFSFLVSLIHIAHKCSSKDDSSSKRQHILKPEISPLWSRSDIQRVEEAMLRVLRAVSGYNWVSWRALRGAVCKVATPDLLDHCLKYLRGKSTVDGMIVVARCNPDSGSCEYRLEPGNLHPDSISTGISSSVTQPSRENLVWDLKFLYESLLHPRTRVFYGPEATRALSISSAEKLLDCKQFVKDYKPEKALSIMTPLSLCLNCEVETLDQSEGNGPSTPPELLVLPTNANLADLKHEASRVFQGVYLIFRRFQAEEVVGYCGVADSTQVKLLLGSRDFVKVRGTCLGKNGLIKFKMERGIERWTVHCSCGAKDDDGERMLACDGCGVWQHTRCSGIPDSDSVPARFICHRCRGSNQKYEI